MAQAAKIVEEYGYDEVNVNCGCPSNKTRDGCFGAVLMFDPQLVARITRSMQKSVNIPVTVKCRLGVDDMDKYEEVKNFIKIVSHEGGVTKFIIHARKCFLNGLSPHENRTIPPLKYDWVFQLKQDFPDLNFVINGGFTTIKSVKEILSNDQLEGCMVGRLAYNTPWELAKVDCLLFNSDKPSKNRLEIL
jgi:tRNA-dihydrouridine synthase A